MGLLASDDQWAHHEPEWETYHSADEMLRRTRERAVAPEEVVLGDEIVIARVDPGRVAPEPRRVLTEPTPRDGF